MAIMWVLLGLYVPMLVGWDLLHSSFHEDVAVHNPLVEKSSCHRSIFHGEKDAHKTHISSFKLCASCHVLTSPGAPPVQQEVTLVSPATEKRAAIPVSCVHCETNDAGPTRAPPFLV